MFCDLAIPSLSGKFRCKSMKSHAINVTDIFVMKLALIVKRAILLS